jgi:hypothetical protein
MTGDSPAAATRKPPPPPPQQQHKYPLLLQVHAAAGH